MGHEAATLSRLGPYVLLEELGSGAMGTVYLAQDEDEDRRVALKVLHPHLLERKGFFKRFQREALAGERVRHPNVVRTLDCDIHVAGETGYCLLVMEYVKGRTLHRLLGEWGSVPEAMLREIAKQVAEGLSAIHDAGIVHRDLKPENVLITDDHRVRIMDLGVARHTELSTALTKEGQFAGSLLYAAPEQFRNREVGPRADLYALGVMLYELASGVNPFRHDEPAAVVNAHLEEIPQRLDHRAEDTSPFLAEVVATLLKKDPAGRFAAASDLAEVLAEGEGSAWWAERERRLLEERTHHPKVPVRRETKLCGREDDLALLQTAWEGARKGEGNTVLLEGEAGIGKSRLVDQFLNDLDGQDAHVLYGSYPPWGGMGAISDALLAHFGRRDLEDALRPYLRVTPSLVPALAAALKREVPLEGAASLQGDVLHGVLVQLMKALASERPLVWVIEDLHFADTDSRRLMLSLARAVADHPVLLLLTTRPGLTEEELAHFGRLETLKRTALRRLGARDVAFLLEDAFRSVALAEKLGIRIAKKSDGIPFFVFEVIRGLREGLFITQLPDGSWIESKEIEAIEVPSAVRDLIEARLQDLGREDRAVLDIGSVLGFAFDPDLIARVRGAPRMQVFEVLGAVERRLGIVRASGDRYRFDHHQMQEILYESLHAGLRREYHLAVAEALTAREGATAKDPKELDGALCVDLCEHFLQGGASEAGLPYLDAALESLNTSYRNDQAIALADRALAAPDLLVGAARVKVLLRKNVPLQRLGRRAAEEAVLSEARALAEAAGEKALVAKAANATGNSCLSLGRSEEAKAHYGRELSIAREIGNRRGEGRATGSLGNVFFSLGRYEEARKHHERNIAIAREIGDRKGEGRATGSLGNVFYALGRYDEARAQYERRLAIAREIGDRRGEGGATGSLGNVFHALGRYDEARAHHERCLAIAREIGDRNGEGGATGNLGLVFFSLGRYDEARAHFERSLAIAREIGDRGSEGLATGKLGSVFYALGRYDEARAHFERSLAIAREIGDRGSEASATGKLGSVFFSLGRYDEARAHFERHLAIAREIGDRRGEGGATGNLGVVFSSLGRYDEARAQYERHLAIAREIGDRKGEANATGNLGLVFFSLGRYEEARKHHERNIAIAREIGDRGGEGNATGNLGSVFSSLGRYEEARKHHELSLAIAREIGDRGSEGLATGNLGNVFHALGRYEEARAHHERRLAIAREIGDRRGEGHAHGQLGAIAEAEGDGDAAVSLYEEALAIFRDIDFPSGTATTLTSLGRLYEAGGQTEEAGKCLEEALSLGRELDDSCTVVLATCHLAILPDGVAAEALAALAEYQDRLGHGTKMDARFILLKATKDPIHLTDAKRLLDHLVEHAPEEYRESMLENVRLNREIMEAWEEHGERA